MDRHPSGAARLRGRVIAFMLLLLGLLLVYAAIIVLGDRPLSTAVRVVLLSAVLAGAVWVRMRGQWGFGFVLVTVACIGITVLFISLAGSARLTFGMTGAAVALLGIGAAVMIISTLVAVRRVDASTVLGVLCVYLLLALVFSSVNQVGAAVHAGQDAWVRGVTGTPTAADLLYFSVVTLCTVGYGDIVPVSQMARALTVVEALTGQLYLVSVVAGVVGGWRAGEAVRAEIQAADDADDERPPGVSGL